MGIYRIVSNKDSFITNRMFSTDNDQRASGSNFGASPSLQVFKLTGSYSGVELARALVQFDLTELSGKIYDEKIIPSGNMSFFLKMYDQGHGDTVPVDYNLYAYPLSRSWNEGRGLDNDNYRDFGAVNWISASTTEGWSSPGGDFLDTNDYGSGSQYFTETFSNLEMNVTDVVMNWLTGSLQNNGFLIKLGTTEEEDLNDYFLKLFASRESKNVDNLPVLEARWEDVRKDNRNNFEYNIENKIFLYNFVRGELVDPGENIIVRVQDNLVGVSASFTASYNTHQIETGILTASILIEKTGSIDFSSSFYDIWQSETLGPTAGRVYLSSSFTPSEISSYSTDQYDEFVVNVDNLKRIYSINEEARLKVSVRKRDYNTHRIVSSASLDVDRYYVEKMYYSIINEETGETVVSYGTGSLSYTQLSYNSDGNYFDLYMNNFIPGYVYRIKFLIDINARDLKEIDDDFIFKVV